MDQPFDPQICPLCWETFETLAALAEHEADWSPTMCSSTVKPEAREPLARLLIDMRRALCPDDPESVVIGPVDFGADSERPTIAIGPEDDRLES